MIKQKSREKMRIDLNRAKVALLTFVAMLFVSALFTRCASVGSPSGGPKDSLPPVIVAMTPDNFTTNMDTLTKRIYIEFDEFVTLNDQQKEFYTSPQMKNKPQLHLRGRGVVVTLRDTLKANTTYALNFGSTIRDNNEGNPLYSMRYVFSTGTEIDSMIISGYAEDSYKADSVGGTFVMLFPTDSLERGAGYDSTLFNATPAVIARAEANGIFLAQNLKPITYHAYAIEDTNSNLTYEPGTDRVGFIDKEFNPTELDEFAIWYDSLRKYVVAEPQLHFRMFMDKPFKRQLLAGSERPLQHKAMLYFSAAHPQIDSIIFDSIASEKIIVEPITEGRDTLALWFNASATELPDTIRGRVVYFKHDSLNELVRSSDKLALSWKFFETKEQTQEREKQERERKRAEERGEKWEEPEVKNPFKVTTTSSQDINPEQSITFDFDYPLIRLDTAAITLQYLSAKAVELRKEMQSDSTAQVIRGANQRFTFLRDTQNIRRWHLRTEWAEPGSEYFLNIPAGTFADIAGFQNDSISKTYTPLDPNEFATLVVNMLPDSLTSSHYILELLSSDGNRVIERKMGIEAGVVTFKYVPAGDVMLRILQDINNNGRWDSGNLIERRQPEKSKLFESKGESKIATKVNWEIEITVDPAALFAEETQAELTERLDKQERVRVEKLKEDALKNKTKR